jgi:tetratricopeptide (TPR) repeat protein
MLPWLRLSAELDPHRIETYVVGSYWLGKNMGRINEAEQFLREGLRENPHSPEILYELGNIQTEHRNNDPRARNLWELALEKWWRFEAVKPEPNKLIAARLHAGLSQVETRAGNFPKALIHLEELKKISPHPEEIQKQIDELRQKQNLAPRP